jgi:opacity protein-like surface antigen
VRTDATSDARANLASSMRILDGSVRSLSHDVKYLGTLRGRLGWTPTSGWLIYGTGGLAWERADRTRSIVSPGGPAVLAFEGVIPRDQFGWGGRRRRGDLHRQLELARAA